MDRLAIISSNGKLNTVASKSSLANTTIALARAGLLLYLFML